MSKSEMFYSIMCSIIASFIFLFIVLILFKPKIKLSPFICKGRYKDSDEDFFSFKLVNTSLFSAYDISMELIELDRYPIANGQMNTRNTKLTLVLDKISSMPSYKPSWVRKDAPYAVIVRSSDKIDEVLKNDYKSVKLQVTLRHGLTGLMRVVTKEYTNPTQIKNGKFAYGLNFEPIR